MFPNAVSIAHHETGGFGNVPGEYIFSVNGREGGRTCDGRKIANQRSAKALTATLGRDCPGQLRPTRLEVQAARAHDGVSRNRDQQRAIRPGERGLKPGDVIVPRHWLSLSRPSAGIRVIAPMPEILCILNGCKPEKHGPKKYRDTPNDATGSLCIGSFDWTLLRLVTRLQHKTAEFVPVGGAILGAQQALEDRIEGVFAAFDPGVITEEAARAAKRNRLSRPDCGA